MGPDYDQDASGRNGYGGEPPDCRESYRLGVPPCRLVERLEFIEPAP
ncbi:MAG: hypothetical protein O3B08_07230 [Proteobacteria bacterium]|nr:hypothetical protein [Pseudomonadota bacterium]